MGKMEAVKLLQSDVLTNTELDSLCTDKKIKHTLTTKINNNYRKQPYTYE